MTQPNQPPPHEPQRPEPQPDGQPLPPPADPYQTGTGFTSAGYEHQAGYQAAPDYPEQPAYAAPTPTYGTPPYGAPAPAAPVKKKRTGLIITAIVAGVLLVLCGVGGVGAYLIIDRQSEGTGAASPADAANAFLTAVYEDQDGAAAEQLVCREARDRAAIDNKITEVEQDLADLRGPSFSWDEPQISGETGEHAEAAVTIKLVTDDEKMSEQQLRLILVKRQGWFVCEVKRGGTAPQE